MGQRHWDGLEDDGRIIRPPTDDESIILQRQMIRDMKNNPELTAPDPWNGQMLSIREIFDQHARLLLVIDEVEARSTKDITS